MDKYLQVLARALCAVVSHRVPEEPPPRLRVRRVDEQATALNAIACALAEARCVVEADYGGAVSARSYGYPASTECASVVARPSRRGILVAAHYCRRINAFRATTTSAAVATLGEWARPLFDGRYRAEAEAEARLEALAEADGPATAAFLLPWTLVELALGAVVESGELDEDEALWLVAFARRAGAALDRRVARVRRARRIAAVEELLVEGK